jgi:hypothetical protein
MTELAPCIRTVQTPEKRNLVKLVLEAFALKQTSDTFLESLRPPAEYVSDDLLNR